MVVLAVSQRSRPQSNQGACSQNRQDRSRLKLAGRPRPWLPPPRSRETNPTADGVPSASRARRCKCNQYIDLLNGTSETDLHTSLPRGPLRRDARRLLDHKLFLPGPGHGGTVQLGDNTLAVVDYWGNVSSRILRVPDPKSPPDPITRRTGPGSTLLVMPPRPPCASSASTTQFIQSIRSRPRRWSGDPGNGALYVTEGGSSGLAKLDPATESVIASAHLGSRRCGRRSTRWPTTFWSERLR